MFNRHTSVPYHTQQNPIIISDSDDSDDGPEPDTMQVEWPQHGTVGYNRYNPSMSQPTDHLGHPIPAYHNPIEQEKKARSQIREERHAALCILMDRELLTIQALAAQETLPQARRRFLARLMAPEDPDAAAVIRADQFTIQQTPTGRPSSSSPMSAFRAGPHIEQKNISKVVSRGIVDVCETDDASWRRPEADMGGASTGPSSGMSTPAMSSKAKGKVTPDRTRNKGRTPSGRHQQQRERRRRWSGAEREGPGLPFHGLPS